MPSDAENRASEVAGTIGELLAREAPELASPQILRLAILAARDLGGLPPEIAQVALRIAEQSKGVPRRRAGQMARVALDTAQEMRDLPEDIARTAGIYAGELGFHAADALAAIDWLAQTRRAVIGVELWRPSDDPANLHWLGTSGYLDRCDESDWDGYVACCARGARGYIEKWRQNARAVHNLPDDLVVFNLSWVTQREAEGLGRARQRAPRHEQS